MKKPKRVKVVLELHGNEILNLVGNVPVELTIIDHLGVGYSVAQGVFPERLRAEHPVSMTRATYENVDPEGRARLDEAERNWNAAATKQVSTRPQ